MEKLQKKIQELFNLYKLKKLSEAEMLTRKLIEESPKVVILYNILGLILTDQKRIDEAIKFYEMGIKIDPNYSMIYNNLGTIYKSKENYKEAEEYYKKSIKLNNNIPEPQNNLGNLYLTLNKHKKAIDCYKKAIAINSQFFISHYNLGNVNINIGKFKDAKKHLEEAVKLNPLFCIAHRVLSSVTKYTKNDEHFKLLKKLYNNSKIHDKDKTELAFALAKAHEDNKDFKNAYKYYSIGNDFRRKYIMFSLKDEKENFNKIKQVFNKKLFDKFKQVKNLDSTAIFVLGMPRSGTTLVEQILSSHPNVFGGDELEILTNIVKKHIENNDTGLRLDNIINFSDKKLNDIGCEYINNIKEISNNSKKVTDKLPINFKWIGLIKLILPKSTIIHCVRNSKDTCLSIYKNYFANPELNFAYNLEEISEFYKLYIDLMKHWEDIFPNFIHNIKYEKIIKDPKKEIHKLLKICSLSWNNNCLKFYNNKRAIKTASSTQARKKIYKSSINSWKNYQNILNKFFAKLPS